MFREFESNNLESLSPFSRLRLSNIISPVRGKSRSEGTDVAKVDKYLMTILLTFTLVSEEIQYCIGFVSTGRIF
jgi:hypothetical protein